MLLFVILSFFFNTILSQNKVIDSLLIDLNSLSSKSEKVDCLNELAWEFRNINIERGINYANKASNLSDSISYEKGFITSLNRKGVLLINKGNYIDAIALYDSILHIEKINKNVYGIARAQNQLGITYKKKGDLVKSKDYYKLSLKNFKSINKEKLVAKISNNLGSIFKELGNTDQAMFYYTRSLKIREKLKDQKGMAYCYLNLGVFHNTVNNYKLAVQELEKSELLFKGFNNQLELSKIYNNLGVAYSNLNKYEIALDYYSKSIVLKKEIGLEKEKYIILNNIGIIYEKTQNYDEAINYYKKSKSLQKKLDSNSVIEINNNLGNVYRKKKQPLKALSYYQKGLKLAKKNHKDIVTLNLLKNIASTYSIINDFKLATHYNKKYIQLQDSIELNYKNAVQIKVNYEEEKNKNVILEKNKIINTITIDKISEENKRKTTLLYAVIIGTLILSILFFLVLKGYKQKQKIIIAQKNEKINAQKIEKLLKNQELKSINTMLFAQEQERKRIAQDLHDRLGSMLSMVKIHFKSVEENIEKFLKGNTEQYETANNLLDEACEEVRKIAHNMSSGILTKFGLVPALKELITTLENSSKIEIEFIDYGLDNRLENELEINIYRIIQELFSNVLKHSNATEIWLQILKNNKRLTVILEDNGVGFHFKKANTGMGLLNIQSRIDKFGGQLDIDSGRGNGTTTTIQIPLL